MYEADIYHLLHRLVWKYKHVARGFLNIIEKQISFRLSRKTRWFCSAGRVAVFFCHRSPAVSSQVETLERNLIPPVTLSLQTWLHLFVVWIPWRQHLLLVCIWIPGSKGNQLSVPTRVLTRVFMCPSQPRQRALPRAFCGWWPGRGRPPGGGAQAGGAEASSRWCGERGVWEDEAEAAGRRSWAGGAEKEEGGEEKGAGGGGEAEEGGRGRKESQRGGGCFVLFYLTFKLFYSVLSHLYVNVLFKKKSWCYKSLSFRQVADGRKSECHLTIGGRLESAKLLCMCNEVMNWLPSKWMFQRWGPVLRPPAVSFCLQSKFDTSIRAISCYESLLVIIGNCDKCKKIQINLWATTNCS